MLRFALFLSVTALIGVWSYEPKEDKSGWFFPDNNPFIMLEMKPQADGGKLHFLGQETGAAKNSLPLPKTGDSTVTKVMAMMEQNHQLEDRVVGCDLPPGSHLLVLDTDPRGQVLVELSHVQVESTEIVCGVGRYTMYTESFQWFREQGEGT